MRQPRQFHHQQEDQQADNEVLARVGALAIDRDVLEIDQK
jgi:hypothetical protein